ncbi:MAG: histidine kinase [Bacteroidales bacterium]|nr:histidine kinase [Bacteroidales bacterium]
MLNSFFHKITYGAIWLASILFFTLTLNLGFYKSLDYAFLDSFVFITLFFLIGFALWYSVKYADLFKKRTLDIMVNHLSIAVVFIIVWLFVSYHISLFLISSVEYQIFIHQSLVFRSIIGILLYTNMIVFFYLRQNLDSFRKRINDEAHLNNLLRDSELQLLRNQINPHFLFNSLNSLNSLIYSDSDRASKMLVELSDFMRYSIHSSKHQFVSVLEEIRYAEKYINIEKNRFGDALNVQIEVCETCYDALMPAMLIQPLIENAVKHGLYGCVEGVFIRLNVSAKELHNADKQLIISVSNNYESGNTSPQGTKSGLSNIQSRLKNLYGSLNRINISSTNNIFEVIISIPFKNE